MAFFRFLVLAALLFSSGCGSRGGVVEEGGMNGRRTGTGPGQVGVVDRDGAEAAGDLNRATGPLAQRVIYFLYDSFELMPEYQPVVSAHAAYLAAHPRQNVVLEGHADERGSAEYNIALGEQRAMAVQRLMQFQDVAPTQIQMVSFGEEKPADPGHDEAAWQKNRRVEIYYPGH